MRNISVLRIKSWKIKGKKKNQKRVVKKNETEGLDERKKN